MTNSIGTKPNQIPVNGYLGDLAYRDFSSLDLGTAATTDSADYATLAGSPTFTGDVTAPNYITNSVDDRVKFGVWSTADTFGIGMGPDYTFGHLSSFATTFQMDATANRGWWWGTTSDTNAQGAMSLTNDGKLHVDDSITVGTTSNQVATLTGTETFTNKTLTDPAITGLATVTGSIQMPGGSTDTRYIEVGKGRTGNGFAYIDLIGDATYTSFGLRIIRNNTGPNAATQITHRGTGKFAIGAADSASVAISTAGTDRLTIDASGDITTTGSLLSPAITAPTITGTVIEDVYAVTGTTPALEPANGSIQTWTLTANSTPTDSVATGEAITLMIDDGTAYTITWPTITWVNNGGAAPTLATTGYTVIALWKVSTTLYGALVGDGS
jgi:hypothetical protein